MDSLGCCWGCGNVWCIDVSNEEHWAALIHWGWERAVKSYQTSQRPAFSLAQHQWARYCSGSRRSCCTFSGKAWRRPTRANILLMPPWGQERQKIHVRYYRRTFCRSGWCNNCWLGEAKLFKTMTNGFACMCLFLSSFRPPPRPPPPLTISMMLLCELGLLPVKRKLFFATLPPQGSGSRFLWSTYKQPRL